MRLLNLLLFVILLSADIFAQTATDSVNERRGMEKLMSLSNLKLSDLTFRDDYTKKDSFRLATIAKLMRHPYGMIELTEDLKDNCINDQLEPILNFSFDNLALESQATRGQAIGVSDSKPLRSGRNLFYKSPELNRLLTKIHNYLYTAFPQAVDSTFTLLNSREKNFILNEFRRNLTEDTADENRPPDEIDSIQKVEEEYIKEFVKFGTRVRRDFIVATGIQASIDIFREIKLLGANIDSGQMKISRLLSDTAIMPPRRGIAEYLGREKGWAIGGPKDDYYKGDYLFILDFGGNDRYDLSYNPDNPHGTIIIDFAGNDIYSGTTDFTIGSGCMTAGLLFDMGGDDVYNGRNFSVGSGYFGYGLLYDKSGSDSYRGDTHVEGAGTFGLGLIYDGGGADLYSASLYAQGFGSTEGMGLIIEFGGHDTYTAGNKYQDVLRYEDHYLSLSQGFAYGFRPYLSGGIGAIADFTGNDTYISDIFAQGTSYWWSLGAIYDSSGNDQYISYQYAQGTATHMTLGILLDQSGNDIYYGKGLMQGCGHDYSCGIMLDRAGNDVYHAYDLSQGAGSANGFGMLIDDRGDDAFYVMKKHNTQGFGDPRRDFGSIGLFLDLGGMDRFDGNGAENSYWKTDSKWGCGMDIEFIKTDTVTSEKK
jgi:hypothetical protein